MNLLWLSCLLVSTVLVNGNLHSTERIIQTRRHLVTLPQILSPTSNQICFTSLNGYIPEDKDLRITLVNPRTNDEIDTFNYKLDSDAQCFNIETEKIETKFVKVKVQLQPHLDVVQLIRFMPSYGMTMIETSKPIYQPGEVLNFRAIGFDGWMKPWDESFTKVSVFNAEGNKVMEWEGAQLEGGLKHYELPLAQYNKEGTWRIIALTKSGEIIEKLFQVNRNVAPEVVLKLKQGGDYVLANEETHRMVICAEDKHGVQLEEGLISLKTHYGHYLVKDLPLEEGCTHFSIKNETLQWSHKVGQAIQGLVEFRNQLVPFPVVTLPVHLPIVRSHVHIRVPSTALVKNYFKLGLPYFGYFLVEKPDYTPFPNAEVEICFQSTPKPWQFDESTEKICKTFTSTVDGSIKFIIPPVERTTKQILIEATIPGVSEHRQNFIVHPWAEETPDQFIVEPIVRVRSCKRSMPEATKYTLLMTRNGTEAFDRLYLQPAGRVSAAQTKTIKLSPAPWTPETDLLIGEWPENTEVYYANVWEDVSSPNKYTPMNRVAFYGLDSRGNLISDSIAYLKDCLKDETLMEVTLDESNRFNIDLKAQENVPCSISIGTAGERGRLTEQKINKLLEKFDDIYAKTFEWDKCSLALKDRLTKQPLMIDFKNNWDTFKEIGLHAVDSASDIFNKPCEWDVFGDQVLNKSHQALMAIRQYLPYSENIMSSLADSADLAHFNRLENSLIKDLLFWGSRSDLAQWLEKFHPSIFNGKSSVAVNAICLDPIKGLRSYTVQRPLVKAPVYLEHDLPKRISDKAVQEVSVYIKRHESTIKESECVPVELEVESDPSFEIRSELPKTCVCSKTTRVTLKVKPLKSGPLNLKIKAKFANSLKEECDSMIESFEPQEITLKTNIETHEPKVTRRSYEIACQNAQKNLKLFKNEEKTHATRDLINVFMKQFRDEEPIRKSIYEVLNKFNALMNMYDQNERIIPSALVPKIREALVTLYQELALFRLANGYYSVYGGSQRVPSLVATTLAYRAITQVQSKLSIFGGAEIINPTFEAIVVNMMKDGCFRPKNYANAAFSMWPFNHEASQLELTAFIASIMAESKQTPKLILRRAARCIDQLKQTEEMDSLTMAMSALLYARINRIEEARTLLQSIDFTTDNEIRRSIPDRFKLRSNEQEDEENVRARAFLVLAKLALNQTEKLEEQIQRLVSSNLSLHDPVVTLAVTRAWPKISVQQRTLTMSLNNERVNLEQFEMKKIEMPKSDNLLLEVMTPGCALLERVELIDVRKYNGTYAVKGEETREAGWSEDDNIPYIRRGFKIIKHHRRENEPCNSRKITICPRQEDSTHRSIIYKIDLPTYYRINVVALDQLMSFKYTPIEMYKTNGIHNYISVGRYYDACFDIPMVQVGEILEDIEEPIAAIFAIDGADLSSQPLVGTIPIETIECSTRVRRDASAQTNNQVKRGDDYQQTYEQAPAYAPPPTYAPAPAQYEQQTYSEPAYAPTYEAPVKGYPAPPAYEQAPVKGYPAPAPSYEAPAYEPAYAPPAKGYSAPPAYEAPAYSAPAPAYPAPAYPAPAPAYSAPAPAYPAPAPAYSAPAPAYPAPAYPAPAYQAPAYPAPAYPAPAYQAPAYPAPAPAYPAPAYPAPAYQAPAYEQQTYQAPAYEPAPVKGYPAPPAYEAPAYGPPAYEAYPAPAYEQQAYQSPPAYEPAYAPPAKGYPAPPAYAPPAPPAYEPAYAPPAKGYPAPPAYAPPAPPAYEPAYAPPPTYQAPAYEPAYAPPAPTYQAPAYEQPAYSPPAKGYPAPPAYAAPAYSPPAYVPPPPTYEAPAKGYAPPPPPTYQAPAYEAPAYSPPAKGYPAPSAYTPPAYRNIQGRATLHRYENNFAPAQQARRGKMMAPARKIDGPRESREYLRYRASAMPFVAQPTENYVISVPQSPCPVKEHIVGEGECPKCRFIVDLDMIDPICNSSIIQTVKLSSVRESKSCGNLTTSAVLVGESSSEILNEFYTIPSGCDCAFLSSGSVIMLSDKLVPSTNETSPDQRAIRFDQNTWILPVTSNNVYEINSYKKMCDESEELRTPKEFRQI